LLLNILKTFLCWDVGLFVQETALSDNGSAAGDEVPRLYRGLPPETPTGNRPPTPFYAWPLYFLECRPPPIEWMSVR